MKYLLILFLLLPALYWLPAQISVTPSANRTIDEQITDEEFASIRAACEKMINTYARRGTIIPPEGPPATTKSANAFKELFKPTAKLFADYFKYSEGPTDIFSYVRDVQDYFEEDGLQFDVEQVTLDDVTPEGTRYYVAELAFLKRMKNYVNDKREVVYYDAGQEREYILTMLVEFTQKDLSVYQIRDIRCTGDCKDAAADQEQYLAISVGAGIPLATANPTDFYAANYGAGSMEFNPGISFGGGISFTSNFLSKKEAATKNLFLTGGLFYRYWQSEQQISGFKRDPFTVTVQQTIGSQPFESTYQRIVGPLNGIESTSIHAVEIPIGISYRIQKTFSSSIHIDAVVKPAVVISSSSSFTGEGTYDGLVQEANFRFLREGAANLIDGDYDLYDVGQNELIEQSTTLNTGLGLWFQLSPTYYTEITNDEPSVGLQISLDLGFNVLSPILAEPSSEQLFDFADSPMPAALANGYFDPIKLHYIGLRVGINLHSIQSVN